MDLPRVVPVGDAALLVEWHAGIDPAASARAIALARQLHARCGRVLRDLVVGFCTMTAYFDPEAIDGEWLEAEVRQALEQLDVEEHADGALLDVPVIYGGRFGPDLPEVAAAAGLGEDEAVALHSGTIYRVYMLGFTPGFAYMASVDPRLALPRRPAPRTRVPAGSVAVAAGQTGIYPDDSPGGWHLIGWTPVRPFDPARAEPFLLHPGDRVRFVPVDPPPGMEAG